MQQDLEDEKNEATIKDLENKVRNYEAALKEKTPSFKTLKSKLKITKLPWKIKTSSFILWKVHWLKPKSKITN
jgi:competence protein ComGC